MSAKRAGEEGYPMRVMIAKFVLEANANIPTQCDLNQVELHFGKDCVDRMQLNQVFEEAGIEVIPAIYADAGSSGVMNQASFTYIEEHILETLRNHLHNLDGIYLHLHGASYVEGIGSGDHHILASIRQIVGPYMPIAIVCDPHGNLTKEYVESSTIIRSYRESPHTDIEETIQFVCKSFISYLHERKQITPVYRKLPLILGGEQSVSNDEPVKSINAYMDTLEQDPRILSCSWHVGYIRHDCPEAGSGIVVIPNDEKHQAYAEEIADQLASFVWERRHEFHYTGLSAEPEEALHMALKESGKPVFLTDSGDNVTSGSTGANTFVLRQVLKLGEHNKSFLFAPIFDDVTYHELSEHEVGQEVNIHLGKGYDDNSEPVNLNVIVKQKARQTGTKLFGEDGDYGGCILVGVKNMPIDLIITDCNHPFVERHQTQAAGADWLHYDIVVLKIGYAFPECIQDGALCIMSLTNGATLQDTSALPYKLIMRPMYPIDQI